MSTEPLNFEPIKDEERSVFNSHAQIDILELFEAAMNSSPEPNIDEKAYRFVADLLAFDAKTELKPGMVALETWDVIINASACIHCRHYGQHVLVKTVRLLGDAGDTWKDYPNWRMETREHWNHRTYFHE
jgi:hypothetical protein